MGKIENSLNNNAQADFFEYYIRACSYRCLRCPNINMQMSNEPASAVPISVQRCRGLFRIPCRCRFINNVVTIRWMVMFRCERTIY